MNLWSALVDRSVPDHLYSDATSDDVKPKPIEKPVDTRREDQHMPKKTKAQIERERRTAIVDGLIATFDGSIGSTLGGALEAKHIELGLRQHEFARLLGMSRPHYSEIKHGHRMLQMAAARRAFALGVDAGVLLAGNAELTGRPTAQPLDCPG